MGIKGLMEVAELNDDFKNMNFKYESLDEQTFILENEKYKIKVLRKLRGC